MERLLAPRSVAIVGLSADPSKHGGRVLSNLRKLDFAGQVWGVNPSRPTVEGVPVFGTLGEVPEPPDLVVCAVPANAVPSAVRSSAGAGGVVVFAGGFSEAGADGVRLQSDLEQAAADAGVRVLGPNSGGIIRPSRRLAASFLTCLDRPGEEIRSGPVGLVTQSGGTGSYIHNLAAAAGGGLAVSISTGNEADLDVADAISALASLDEVRAIALLLEAVRRGPEFVESVRRAQAAGKPVVACRIGIGRRGQSLMASHTGAMATSGKVLDGVLDSLGVTVVETPEELLAVAEIMARTRRLTGRRVGIVTHSGGVAILLADLAEHHHLELPHPSPSLSSELAPLLQLGSADNPLDMGAIIGGPGRFPQVVDRFARSGDFDCVLAVSTAHPPTHTVERVEGLLTIDAAVPLVHLWMAGDLAHPGLELLRASGAPLTTEPRAAIRALAGLSRLVDLSFEVPLPTGTEVEVVPRTEHEVKAMLAAWGLRVADGGLAESAAAAVELAQGLGGPVAMKVSSADIAHKTEAGGVALGLVGPDACRVAFERIMSDVATHRPEAVIDGVRVERMVTGVEVLVGFIRHQVFGPMALVGLGGLAAEGLGTEVMALAPVAPAQARRMVGRIPGLEAALGRRGPSAAALTALAEMLTEVSGRFAASGLVGFEMNPVVWDGTGWVIVDGLVEASGPGEPSGFH